MNTLIKLISGFVLSAYAVGAWADVDEKVLSSRLQEIAPEIELESVQKTDIKGIYEVVASGSVMYATEDGKYLFYGDLIDLEEGGVNLSEVARANMRLAAIAEAAEEEGDNFFIRIGPDDADHTVVVYTDIDCSYCRQLHREIPKLNEKGIAVEYGAFPRAGIGSDSYDKIVQVWCADDPGEAMGLALNGRMRSVKECESPEKFEAIINRHLVLVEELRLTGTPALIFENGALMPGYLPADALAQQVEFNQAD